MPLAIKGESPSRQEKGPGGLRKELYNMFVVDIGNVIKLLQESPTAKKMYTSLVENSSAKTREYLRKVIDELAKY